MAYEFGINKINMQFMDWQCENVAVSYTPHEVCSVFYKFMLIFIS